ncbi:MAG: indole-3-glycerol-phosphate synthase TrpC, partial [Planctomycetota bacterium]
MRDDTPDILKKICRAKRSEIETLKARGRGELEERAGAQSEPRGFQRALAAPDDISLIAEVKKASPSAGAIRPDF